MIKSIKVTGSNKHLENSPFLFQSKGVSVMVEKVCNVVYAYCVVEIRAGILEVACCEFSSKFPPLHLTV